jgi:DMSO/TMAO reductase YedYZ molybdopterin-dependent catalytic subunit
MTDRKAPRNPHGLFVIEGDCQRPQAFGPLDLGEVHPNYVVNDLSTVDERLSGKGVRLRKLIDVVGPGFGTAWLTIESLHGFRACLPLKEIARTGIVVFEKGGKPLGVEDGGPARLIVPYFDGEASDVKALSRLVISREPTLPPKDAAGRKAVARS